jgi:hypothetical protein
MQEQADRGDFDFPAPVVEEAPKSSKKKALVEEPAETPAE